MKTPRGVDNASPRTRLMLAAIHISCNRREHTAKPWTALRKLLVQERRDWSRLHAPRTGWKRGELFEVLEAVICGDDWRTEWGDVGYYVAQAWDWLWRLYAAITPQYIIICAAQKFERRAVSRTSKKIE